MQHAPLVETTRGIGLKQHTENIHFGSVAVVDTKGKLVFSAGDPHFLTFTRSTIKPFQATPLVASGAAKAFELDSRELALMCSSHSGEDMHVDTVHSIFKKTGSLEAHLQCGCHVPMYFASTNQKPPAGSQWQAIQNNCSGKHAGFLAWCSYHNKLPSTYLKIDHPLQAAVRKSLSIWCDQSEDKFLTGIDGCSAPNYALPLSSLALAYARLADDQGGDVAKQLFGAMTAHPELVSGTNRHDLAFMQTRPNDWVAKIGADAVQVLGIRSAGLGIAVKVIDGNQRAVIAATINVLKKLGLLNELTVAVSGSETASPLAQWAQTDLMNAAGIQTGCVRAIPL